MAFFGFCMEERSDDRQFVDPVPRAWDKSFKLREYFTLFPGGLEVVVATD